MTYSITDSRKPDIREAMFPDVKDALKHAMKSGLRVYLHSDDCSKISIELGARCPCNPLLIVS